MKKKRIEQIVVCGVEAHVCVLQTVVDLLAQDFQVHLAADAVSSRRKFDYEIALMGIHHYAGRMENNDAEVTLRESVLFELLNTCETDEFKAVSKLIK